MIEETLKRAGLSEKEVQVYLVCLEQDEQLTPSQISKKTRIPRTTVYDIVMELSLKGLVELHRSDGLSKQQTLIKSKNPSALRKMLWEKRKDLVNLEADILNIIPQLKEKYEYQNTDINFQFYPGIEGAKKVYFDTTSDELGLPQLSWDKLLPMDIFGNAELDKHIAKTNSLRQPGQTKIIVPLNEWTLHVISYQSQKDPNYLKVREIRYIDSPSFNTHLYFKISGNYVSMVSEEGDEVWGAVIKSKNLASTLESVFWQTWEKAIPIQNAQLKTNEFIKEAKSL